MDRATVARYADMDDMTPKPPMDRRRGSKIDPYAALVDEWLEADRMLPRRQRHTARRVHDRLRAETGYDGEYTTTPGYVRRWREANRSGSDGYGELVWAPGVAQIDFGVAKARIAGELVDDHCLVVTFPRSNMRYVTSLPGENAECLCHGLVEVFEHIGGVPPVIVMDNATGAGRRNARGEVTPAAVFDAFLAHHRIGARFCDPYSGWEKGAVENAVGFLRRNLMVPPLEAETHAQLGRIMHRQMRCAGRLVEALPQGHRHRGRVRGGSRGADAAAFHHVRPDQMGEPQGRQVRADRHRLEPVPRRRRAARKDAPGRHPPGRRADHRSRYRGDRRAVPPGIRTEPVHAAGSGTGHARARGQTRILEGIVDTPRFPRGRARMARRGRFQTPRAEPQIDRRGMRGRRINTPVIILTARGEEYDKLAGLEGGADDYVVKPFSPRELVARVKAVLNRTMPRTEASDSTMTFGELSIDTASHTVKVSGEEVSLTPKEFDLLVFLASNKGIALSREKILQKVWNYDYFGEDRTVDTHVKMLRGHLGKCRGYIATVWGIGYKFDPDAAR